MEFYENIKMYKRIDWVLFVACVSLTVFGLVAVFSATRTFGTYTNVSVQAAAAAIGFVIMLALCIFDYEELIPFVRIIYIICAALLVIVLVMGITGVWGSKSWIKIGGISIQPSELVKLGFIITLSYHLSQTAERINKFPVLFGLGAHLAAPVFLIMLQPDLGTAVVFVFVFAVMVFTAGISFKFILPVLGLSIASAPVIYYFLSDYQKNRIQVFLNPELDPLGSGYNVIQSKIALGSGRLTGNGYLEGVSTQMGYLPAKHTDFIFSSASEEFGFAGAVLIVAMLFVVIFRVVKIGMKADNLFGKNICTGVASMLFFHTFENIGMCMGLLPVTGIPLPFLSYGGTSLITNFAAVGIVLSVAYHTKQGSIFCHKCISKSRKNN